MKTIKLGLVGLGHRGRGMLSLAVKHVPGVQAAAVCDINADLLKEAAADFPGVPAFTDFAEMLRTVPMDALLVETPASCHAEFCIRCLEKNIHVMSDIPSVDNADEADRLWAAQQRSRALFMTGANPNMWGWVDAAVDLKQQGQLGEPYYVEVEYVHDIRQFFQATPWRETYVSIKYCTHSLGPVLRLMNEDLTEVVCFDTGSHVNRKPGQHDAMAALFRTPSNVVVRLLTSFVNNHPFAYHALRVYGTQGYFERTPPLAGKGSAKTLFYSAKAEGDKQLTELPIGELQPNLSEAAKASGHGGADYVLLDRFVNAIRNGLPSPISLREGLRMTLPGLYAAESAARGGQPVPIRYPWS